MKKEFAKHQQFCLNLIIVGLQILFLITLQTQMNFIVVTGMLLEELKMFIQVNTFLEPSLIDKILIT